MASNTSMARHHGFRRKTRSVLTKRRRVSLSAFLIDYKVGDKVIIVIDPSQVKGMPHRRFQGLVGTVNTVMRRVIQLDVPVGGKVKKVITRLEHIKPQGGY